jgi:hypothetical protein
MKPSNTDPRHAAEYKVFVAGLPSSLKYKYVLEFFAQTGPVVRIESINRGSNRSVDLEDLCSRGCCVLVTHCPKTFDSLTRDCSIKLLGRSLICKKYLERSELDEHNKRTNLQRVLLKRVPAHITEQQLSAFLSREFGKVLVVYPFKTQKCQDKIVLEKRPKSLLTYSVTFENPRTAQWLSDKGQVYGPDGSEISVHQFQHLGRARRQGSGVEVPLANYSQPSDEATERRLPSDCGSKHLKKAPEVSGVLWGSLRSAYESPVRHKLECTNRGRWYPFNPHEIKPTSVEYRIVSSLYGSNPRNLRMNLPDASNTVANEFLSIQPNTICIN